MIFSLKKNNLYKEDNSWFFMGTKSDEFELSEEELDFVFELEEIISNEITKRYNPHNPSKISFNLPKEFSYLNKDIKNELARRYSSNGWILKYSYGPLCTFIDLTTQTTDFY